MRRALCSDLALWGSVLSVVLLTLSGCVPGGGGGGGGGGEGGRPGEDDGAIDAQAMDAAMCQPDCGERLCGDDGCGASCGECADGAVCSIAGACVDVAATCGDGMCADGEDCATCPADCGQCCGNGVCEPGQSESCATCVADCACPAGEMCAVEARRCVDLPPDGGVTDLGVDGGPGPDAGTGPPRILTLNANRRTLTEGGRLVLSAVVTDPDGIGDVIGGVLESPEGASYGAFATAGEEGAYGLTLSWDDLHAVQPIAFGQGQDELRRFDAVFFDQGGDSVRQSLEITLTCEGNGACAGACTDLTSADDCGRCGNDCGADVAGIACVEGMCQCPPGAELCDGGCVDLRTADDCGVCGNACAEFEACVAARCVCEGDCLRPREGDLAVTEFMPDPQAVTDANGEWFEVSNISGRPLSLDGVAFGNPDTIPEDGADSIRLADVLLPIDGILIFGKRADRQVNGGVTVDVPFATLSLRNTDDVIAIVDRAGRLIYALGYLLPEGYVPGASWQVDPRNDAAAAGPGFPRGWCQSAAPWPGSVGDLGSPGAANMRCP